MADLSSRRRAFLALSVGLWASTGLLAGVAYSHSPAASQDQGPQKRDITVGGRKFAFDPPSIDVQQNDLVKISFTAQDIAHSFTIDSYRIAKRANAGQTVVFEFRADQPGTFRYYCNLSIDEGCRNMQGELRVRPAR